MRFAILDRTSRSWRSRVRAAELVEGDERVDVGAYLELLAREAETLLAPLGVRRDDLLARWGAAERPERAPYRSAERLAQRALAFSPGAR